MLPPLSAAINAPPVVWDVTELSRLLLPELDPRQSFAVEPSKYNPTPGTGRTGVAEVPPNKYPFYSDDEVYVPVIQPDGGQLSEWSHMYAPTKEQAEQDRAKAYALGIPHGFIAADVGSKGALDDDASLVLWVISELHTDDEYGTEVNPKTGQHTGGPFSVRVDPKIRVEQLRCVIRDVGGIIPGLQRLSYAGKRLEDSQRTLEHKC